MCVSIYIANTNGVILNTYFIPMMLNFPSLINYSLVFSTCVYNLHGDEFVYNFMTFPFRQCTPYTKVSIEEQPSLLSFAKFLELKFYSEMYMILMHYQSDQNSARTHSVHKNYMCSTLAQRQLSCMAVFQYIC